MPFEIVRNDITHMATDAIVNTANPRSVIGSGTDSAVHQAAGPKLLEARRKIGDIVPGCAAVTPGYGLKAKYVIHAVGPAWQGGGQGEEETLRKAYDSALTLALEQGCRSVAFPLMASGSHGFPKDRALSIAVEAFSDFLQGHEMAIYLVVFNKAAFVLSRKLRDDVKSYIDEHYVEVQSAVEYPRGLRRRTTFAEEPRAALPSAPMPVAGAAAQFFPKKSLEERLQEQTETFTQALLRIIAARGWTEPEVYTRVDMDRKTFNKIRNNPNHQPSKRTALQLAVALQLDLEETRDFIAKAGYTLTSASKFDVIVSYFIEMGNYNINDINTALFDFTEMTLSRCG